MMTGSRLLLAAQKYVDERFNDPDLLEGFNAAGVATMNQVAMEASKENKKTKEADAGNSKLEKTGVPASCTTGEKDARHSTRGGNSNQSSSPRKGVLDRKRSIGFAAPDDNKSPSPKRRKTTVGPAYPNSPHPHSGVAFRIKDEPDEMKSTIGMSELPSIDRFPPGLSSGQIIQERIQQQLNEIIEQRKTARFADEVGEGSGNAVTITQTMPKSILKNQASRPSPTPHLDPTVLRTAAIVGTSSAKLSYILSKVVAHEADEKIIIFFDSNNHAWYISECLELLNIPHLIYVRGLKTEVQSAYIDSFNNNPQVRVLLMDLVFGAHGLNLNAASMVLFVNPVCRPDIEAQAVKRAHRIGQKRQVLVETLVLKGTVEEAMLERAERMTRGEHKQARLLEDDEGIKSIIQNATILPLPEGEKTGQSRMVSLDARHQIFDRPDKGRSKKIEGIDKDELDAKPKRKNAKIKSRTAKADKSFLPAASNQNQGRSMLVEDVPAGNEAKAAAAAEGETGESTRQSDTARTGYQRSLIGDTASIMRGEALAMSVVTIEGRAGGTQQAAHEWSIRENGRRSLTGNGAQHAWDDFLSGRHEEERPSIFGGS
jgi:hypothetical protein